MTALAKNWKTSLWHGPSTVVMCVWKNGFIGHGNTFVSHIVNHTVRAKHREVTTIYAVKHALQYPFRLNSPGKKNR